MRNVREVRERNTSLPPHLGSGPREADEQQRILSNGNNTSFVDAHENACGQSQIFNGRDCSPQNRIRQRALLGKRRVILTNNVDKCRAQVLKKVITIIATIVSIIFV